MGRDLATVALAIVSTKDPEHFRTTPAGYFHGMVQKAKAGELHLERTVWALRRGLDHAPLRRLLRAARDFGLDTLESIIRSRTDYDYEFRKDYLSWHIHYHLGTDEKRGLARFMELLRKHGSAPLHEPKFVI